MSLTWAVQIGRRWARLAWHGPSDLPRSLRLEWRFVLIRWFGIVCVAPGLPFAGLNPVQLQRAYALLVVAAIYNALVQLLIRHRPGWVSPGYLTSACDALLNAAMLFLGGGFDSPLSNLLFTVVISAAMRYGYGPAFAMATFFTASDILASISGGWVFGAGFFFRAGFLYLTAALAGYLRQQASNAEDALGVRLQQANLLNDSTAKLGASLELENVLRAVASAAGRLFRSSGVVLIEGVSHHDSLENHSFVAWPEGLAPGDRVQLQSLCRRYLIDNSVVGHGHELFVSNRIDEKRTGIVLSLCSPSQSVPLATIALLLPAGTTTPELDRDILDSFSKRATLALENASLYRTLASRSSDLQGAYADLEQAHRDLLRVDEMKTDFLANVSHEFRTPLTSIRSFSELLLTYGDTVETQREFVEIINTESERLTRMVNDVLDITKIESGYMDWQMATVDLGALVQDTARSYRQMIESQNLYLDVDVEPGLRPIYGDRDRILQVIGNLLSNASKFTSDGGITLRAEQAGANIIVTVTDTGIGIDPIDHDRVFEKFQQVGAVLTNKPRGTGLGLPICREIVEFHRGRLWVNSRLGSGSTFGFSLPALVGDEHVEVRETQLMAAVA